MAEIIQFPNKGTLIKGMEELAKVSGERNTYSDAQFAGTGGVAKTYNIADYMNKTATEATQYKAQSGGILAQTELVSADTLGLNNIGDALDSNAAAQTKTTQARWAQQTKLSSDGTRVEVYDKVDQYTNGEQDTYKNTKPTIVGTVAGGLVSAMTMLSLGKTISSAFYSLNPTVWDDAGFDLMNPEKWAENLIEAPNGRPNFSDLAVMTLLQFDYNGKSAFQYISEDVLALITKGLAKVGLLNKAYTPPTPEDTTGAMYDTSGIVTGPSLDGTYEFVNMFDTMAIYTIPAGVSASFGMYEDPDADKKTGGALRVYNETTAAVKAIFFERNSKLSMFLWGDSEEYLNIRFQWGRVTEGTWVWGTKLFGAMATIKSTNWPTTTIPDVLNVTRIGYGGINNVIGGASFETAGLKAVFTLCTLSAAALAKMSGWETSSDEFLLNQLWNIANATEVPAGVEGVGDQAGATQLTESEIKELADDSTTHERTLEILKGRFTDLWQNRLETSTVQADGTVKKTTWVNTGTPNEIDTNGNGMVVPDSSKGTAGSLQKSKEITFDPAQLNPNETVDPGDATAPSVLNSVLNSFRPNAGVEDDPNGEPAPAPDPAEEYEDPTDSPPSKPGAGVTPPVVIPSGSGGALFTVYNPSETEIKAFGAWMWSSDLIDQLKKLFSDPMQAVIGLHKVFIPPLQGGEDTIQVGYLDSGVPSTVVRQQYSQVNCGSVDVPEFFGNVFDYAPHTRIQLYLPFIGIVDLDPADVMRSTITVKYVGDAYTGACIANVYVKRDGNECCLYTFNGDTSVRYPISSGSYLGLASGVIGTVTSLAVGMTNPIFGAAGVLNSIGSMRTNVKHAGNLGGAPGAMGIKYPYLIITRPQTATATNFQKYVGKPANVLALVSQCSGFTRIEGCQVSNINEATEEEKAEIEKLLSSGFLA